MSSKKPTDKLHELIKNLTKAEKITFKKKAPQGKDGTSDYVALYDALEGMKVYNEAKLRQKYKGANFLKHLTVKKSQLYDILLETIRYLKQNETADAKIKNLILDARYMRDRGLYRQSEQLLRRAKKLAELHMHHLALLEINQEERIHAKRTKLPYDEMTLLIQKDIKQFHEFEEVWEMMRAFDDLSMLAVVGHLFPKGQSKIDIQNKYKELLDPKRKQLLTGRCLFWYLQAAHFYHNLFSEGDYDYYYNYDALQWWDNRPEIKKEELNKYTTTVLNLLTRAFHNKKYETVEKLLDEFYPKRPITEEDFELQFMLDMRFNLLYYMNRSRWDMVQKISDVIKEGLKTYDIPAINQIAAFYNIACQNFILGNFNECADLLTQLIKLIKINKVRGDLFNSSHLLLLICATEDIDVEEKINIEPLIRRANRLFKKVENNKFEMQTLQFIQELLRTPHPKHIPLVESFLPLLDLLAQNENYAERVGFDEVTLWLKAKLERTTIQKILEKRAD